MPRMTRPKRAKEFFYKHRTWWELPEIVPGECTGCIFEADKRAEDSCPGLKESTVCIDPAVIFITPLETAFNDYINLRTTIKLGVKDDGLG
jgi:hypothetical protein